MGVTSDEKMAYFILKWVFNAIKREEETEFVLKGDLSK